MTLFILEYQAMNDGSCTMTPPLGYSDRAACETAYFNKCAAAVQSTCDCHTVVITTAEGEIWRNHKQVFRHGIENEE